MNNEDKASIRETYELVEQLRKENNAQGERIIAIFEDFHKAEFNPLRDKVQALWSYGAVIIVFISLGGGLIIDWIKKNIFHI